MNAYEIVVSGCAILGLLFQVYVVAFKMGRFSRAQEDHDNKFLAIDADQRDQWASIGRLREDVGKLKGATGVNGHA